ncbi:MAG TPA: collagen-like protein [Ligilactobacillus acidipiscis]|uniref:Collagen-like protein n=1 Tax=Ligilactobacillus acidipiscis TaxID=89059 RepID=A0A921FAH7_9LACO|nr:collagen-like protein [Ligilactobacillus acidipiscis]
MAYEQQEWGTYAYDESKSLAENIAAAKAVDALVTVDKIKHMEQGIANEQVGPQGEAGAPGKDGATGPAGSDAKQIKSGVINEDKSGIVTGITVTFTDNTTVDFSVNKATE